MSLLILAVVVAGFGPFYYYLPFTGGDPDRPISVRAHLHAALFSSWVLLLIVQVGLVTAKRTALHIRLGRIAYVLAPAMILSGAYSAIALVAEDPAMKTGTRTAFLVSVLDLVVFAALVWLGVRARRDAAAHKRFMLLAAMALLGATAVARMPLPDLGLDFGRMANAFIWAELLLVPLLVRDVVAFGRPHRATVIGTVAILSSHLVQAAFIKWPVTRGLADAIGTGLSS
jgi:hypothetical protein